MAALADPLLQGEEGEGDGWLDFDKVVREERECIDRLHAARHSDKEWFPDDGEPFSLAFSGGGIRAAAFQAGVLWRLAQMNRLKDVEYFTAVSGGGYITSAFASHCIAAEPPEPGKVRQWYMDVVAKTITRMQDNAGDFVRDCVKNPGYETEGAGFLPRALDLPILLVTLACTLLVNPLAFLVVFVVPMVLGISAFYGAAMRAAFCVLPETNYTWREYDADIVAYHESDDLFRWNIYYNFSPIVMMQNALLYMAGLTMVVFILQKLVPCCKLRAAQDGRRPTASTGYLLGHAAYGFLKRATIAIAVLLMFLFLVPLVQTSTYDLASRVELCNEYIETQKRGDVVSCVDTYVGSKPGKWYEDDAFAPYANHSKLLHAYTFANESAIAQGRDRAPELLKGFFKTSTIYLFFLLWLVLMIFSICIMPVFGSSILVNTLFVSGPLFVLVWLMAFVQYIVFGPITKNRKGLFTYDEDFLDSFVTWSLVGAFFLIPFYEELRSTLHVYYKRCLQVNFFAGGQDAPLREVGTHPYCPFIMLTGTSSDFQPPGDVDVISELSFSALHTGSEETGYVQTPEYRSLAKCTALTGAGCLDAISLSMNDALALRFWLEVLNLSWGDYILFQSKPNSCISGLTSGMDFSGLTGGVTRMLHRVPAGVVWMLAWIWLLVAWHHERTHDCKQYRELLRMAATAMAALVGLSFFSFLPVLDWLSMAPLLRQMQQATKYFYVGSRPPQMLYVTDGGVKDCTALVQLMRRKCKRILLVLAAADPHDDLGVLKAAMDVAKEQKLGCFYDPVDPRRDLSRMFEEYKKDRTIPFLHIGISYCWPDAGKEETTGHLYIVKNRLPTEFEGQNIQPLLTPEEVLGQVERGGEVGSEWEGMKTDELGPFGCCDCCHTNHLNCGPKFPHGSFTGYMYLSPQWSNSLTRLGHAVSEQAIACVSRKQPLSAGWEAKID